MRSRCGGRGYIMVREEAERLANIWCHTLDRVGEEAPGLMCGRRALLLLRKKGLQNNRCDVRGGGVTVLLQYQLHKGAICNCAKRCVMIHVPLLFHHSCSISNLRVSSDLVPW